MGDNRSGAEEGSKPRPDCSPYLRQELLLVVVFLAQTGNLFPEGFVFPRNEEQKEARG